LKRLKKPKPEDQEGPDPSDQQHSELTPPALPAGNSGT
jgi:hypothetical protein